MTTTNRLGNIGTILSSGTTRPRLPDPELNQPAKSTTAAAKQDKTTAARPAKAQQRTQPATATPPAATPTRSAHTRARHAGNLRVPVKLTPELRKRTVAAAAAQSVSLSEFARTAIERAHTAGQLAQTVTRIANPSGNAPDGQMFSRPKPTAGTTVITEFLFAKADTAVLDNLVKSTGATSRTQLITAALTWQLDNDPEGTNPA